MKAVVTSARGVMELLDVPEPGEPGVAEVLLKPDAVGPDCPAELGVGQRVAVWPVHACGHCYPCRIGRENVCVNLSLVGVHRDGALQEQLHVPASQVFPVGDLEPTLAAFIEPVSIAMRAVVRARVAAGE